MATLPSPIRLLTHVSPLQMEIHTFQATPEDGKNSYVATIDCKREVQNSGLQYAYVQACYENANLKTFQVVGDLTFHNPYGYLPVSTQRD